ncbi:MAG: cyclodeaminase/cyclohydrolase family protein, partial [Halobacteriaceae archaeon]
AALSGAMGAGLGEMVCNLTIGKDEYAEVERTLSDIRTELSNHRERLLELADEDSEAFDEVMAAFKTPEDEGRAEAIEEASKLAAEVPLETATECLAVIEKSIPIAQHGNQNSITDAGTGALMAYAGLQAALYNVEINLESINDEEYVAGVREEVAELRDSSKEAVNTVTESIEESI